MSACIVSMYQPAEPANVVLSYLAHDIVLYSCKMSHLLKISAKIDIVITIAIAYLSKRGDTMDSKILKHLIEPFALLICREKSNSARSIRGKIQQCRWLSGTAFRIPFFSSPKKEKEKKRKNTRREHVLINKYFPTFDRQIGFIDCDSTICTVHIQQVRDGRLVKWVLSETVESEVKQSGGAT